MHASVCLLHAGQPRNAGDAAKLGQFVGKFSVDHRQPNRRQRVKQLTNQQFKQHDDDDDDDDDDDCL